MNSANIRNWKRSVKALSGIYSHVFLNIYSQVYKGEHSNPATGEKKLVALKKLNMINEKDGV